VAESVVENLDSNFVLLGRINRDLFDRDGLAGFPSDGYTIREWSVSCATSKRELEWTYRLCK
jgi:hypothetical protein